MSVIDLAIRVGRYEALVEIHEREVQRLLAQIGGDMTDEEIRMREIEHDAIQAEKAFQESLKEDRAEYQLRQIGLGTRRFKVDLTIPF